MGGEGCGGEDERVEEGGLDIGEDGVSAVGKGVPEGEGSAVEFFREEGDKRKLDVAEVPGEEEIRREKGLVKEDEKVREEAERPGATEQHHQRNRDRLTLLQEQRADLAAALDALLVDIAAGKRRFKLYRQMKMYNDPELNPAVYNRRS